METMGEESCSASFRICVQNGGQRRRRGLFRGKVSRVMVEGNYASMMLFLMA
jgi:hypothetical protein